MASFEGEESNIKSKLWRLGYSFLMLDIVLIYMASYECYLTTGKSIFWLSGYAQQPNSANLWTVYLITIWCVRICSKWLQQTSSIVSDNHNLKELLSCFKNPLLYYLIVKNVKTEQCTFGAPSSKGVAVLQVTGM